MNQTERNDEVEVDLLQLVRALWKKAWVIVLCAILMGGMVGVGTKLFVTPIYESQIVMYVNNKNPSEQNQSSINQGDLSTAQHLVDTYMVFLQSRSTLDDVLTKTGLPYSYEQIKRMVSATSVNGTEAFRVVVKNTSPEEAALIANTIGEVLPGKIADFIPGSSAKIVDYAIAAANPSSPNVMKNAVLGGIMGVLLSSAVIVVFMLMDNQIHDADYLTQTFDIPVLAVIPDLVDSAHSHAGYYKESTQSGAAHSKNGGK